MDNLGDKIEELGEKGYCVLTRHFAQSLIDACRGGLLPRLHAHIEQHEPNRGTRRYFVPMPFEPPCFAPEFFFDDTILGVVRAVMDDRIVADQWGCDVPLNGSGFQAVHMDYAKPLFSDKPDLSLPPFMLIVSFGLNRIARENGPIEIATGTHRLPRGEAISMVEAGEIELEPVGLEVGDVLIRHPWALHRGSPNTTPIPRALVSIRYVRWWYADDSRNVNVIPREIWEALTPEQQHVMRFPLASASTAAGGLSLHRGTG